MELIFRFGDPFPLLWAYCCQQIAWGLRLLGYSFAFVTFNLVTPKKKKKNSVLSLKISLLLLKMVECNNK